MKLKAVAFLAAMAVGAVVYAQNQRTLIINSAVASTDVRIIEGRAYAPIADVAKGLDLTVVVKGNTYELTKKGGANAMGGLTGKTGDWLFDGGWRFRVNKTYKATAYKAKNDYYGTTDYEAPEDREMIIVEYSYRNGNKELMHFNIGKTSLAGADGDAWEPHSNDFAYDGDRYFARGLLPGAQAEGALIFFVKPGFQPKDLVMTIGEFAGYDDAVKPKKPSIFRIGLKVE